MNLFSQSSKHRKIDIGVSDGTEVPRAATQKGHDDNQRETGRCCVLRGGVPSHGVVASTLRKTLSVLGSCYCHSRNLCCHGRAQAGNH